MVPASRRRPHQAARLGPHVGATVAADLGLVAHPAERDADELAAEGVRHRLAERRLADARRPDEGQDGPRAAPVHRREPALGLQLAHGQVLEDALLHVGQTVVVGLQNPRRLGDVEPVLGLGAPGDLEHGVEPRADPARLGALVAGALELVDLALDRLADVLGEVALPRSWPGSRRGPRRRSSPLSPLSSLRMASSWRRSRNSRCVFSMPSSTSVLIFSRSVTIGQRVAGPPEDEAEPRLDVARLEHLDLLGQREVGRVARPCRPVGSARGSRGAAPRCGRRPGCARCSRARRGTPGPARWRPASARARRAARPPPRGRRRCPGPRCR